MITEDLFAMRDPAYAEFQRKLLPTVAPERIVGVRTPQLRQYAAKLSKTEEAGAFLASLPHAYFEENQLHAFILSEMRDFTACAEAVDRFLPFVDNWATCDQPSPRAFRKNKEALLGWIVRWMDSVETYTVRFGIKMLMDHFLDEDFDTAYPARVAEIRSEEYYVRMMAAWYFATALAKQYDAALPLIRDRRLDRWTHNRAIQKAIESRRITPDQKAFLRSLRIE